jgi:hypothetical protein
MARADDDDVVFFINRHESTSKRFTAEDAEKKDYHVIASDRRERGNLNKNHARLLRR